MGGKSSEPLVVGKIEDTSTTGVSIIKKRSKRVRTGKRVILAIEDDERPGVVDKPIKLGGFKRYARRNLMYRDPQQRMDDYAEIGVATPVKTLTTQAARCMNCGVPFCHEETNGCPLGNKYVVVFGLFVLATVMRIVSTQNQSGQHCFNLCRTCLQVSAIFVFSMLCWSALS